MRLLFVSLSLVILIAIAGFATATLDVYFMDVGHGDAILIDCGDWEALLDAGSRSETVSEQTLSILDECVEDHIIELLILSHPHEDHYSFFADVFSEFGVLEIWRSADAAPSLFNTARAAYPPSLDSDRPDQRELTYGERQLTGCLLWTVLGPSDPIPAATDDRAINDNSLVLLLQYGTVSFLFAGDIHTEAEPVLLRIDLPQGTLVLKVPHHGSANSASPDFVARTNPELAIVSGLREDLSDAVVVRLGDEGVPFLTTFENGTICVSTDGSAVRVRVLGTSMGDDT
jgi:competence protein ComEC